MPNDNERADGAAGDPAWVFAMRGEDDGGGTGGTVALAEASTLELDIYDRIGESFWFGGVSAKYVRQTLKSNKKASKIKVKINSRGGDVLDGSAIYTLLAEHPAQIEVSIDGVAASMASIIAMAGDEIRMSSAAYLMIHNPWGVAMGDAAEMRQFADTLDKMRGTLANIYVAKSGQSLEQITQWMDAETWMNAADAKERGFIDAVVQPRRSQKKATARAFAALRANLDDYPTIPEPLRAQLLAPEPPEADDPEPPAAEQPPPAPEPEPKNEPAAPPAPTEPPETKPMTTKAEDTTTNAVTPAVIRALGLPAGASESDAHAAATRLRELEIQVIAITGVTTSGEALGAVRALKEQGDQNAALRKENLELKAQRDKQNFETQIQRGYAERKLSEPQAKYWNERFDARMAEGRGSDLVDELKGFLNVATTIFAAPKTPPAPNGGTKPAPLTFNGKSYAEMKGGERHALSEDNPELFRAMSDEYNASQGIALQQ